MNEDRLMREWFGAVRTAADLAVKQLGEQTPLNAAQKRKADILLRQLLADELPELAAEAEGFDETRAQKLKKDVYSELMEDALAGTGFGWEDMELLRFLDACSRGVTAEEVFLERFGQVLGPHALSGEELIGTASRVRVSAEQKLTKFAEYRKEKRMPKPTRYLEGPPEGIDEFEYIDWVISH